VQGTRRRDGETLQSELEDLGGGLGGTRVRWSNHCRENLPETEPLQTRPQREVEVGDDGELQAAAPQPLEGLANAREQLELHRLDVDRREFGGVEGIGLELLEEEARAFALESGEGIGSVGFDSACCVHPPFGLEGATDRVR